MNRILEQILNKRGITGEAEIEEYLSLTPRRSYDPFLLKGMREGVGLILSAVGNNKKITIYGDYDADGITATVIMKTILAELGVRADHYIPSRFTEGYGLNKEALKKIKDRGTDLVISVDCGSVSFEEVEYAKEIGLDIVVTDHHNCDGGVADTIVINPHQPGCTYPFKDLAGCGVAYKLALALRDERGIAREVTNRLLDMVALGTVADIVPLVDENRSLVKYGIRELNAKKRPGIRTLARASGIADRFINSEVISFILAPRVNASGRIGDASYGVELFMAETDELALPFAEKLIDYNTERKALQESTLKACLELEDSYIKGYAFPVIETDDAHEGISGIVAGQLSKIYNRPVAIVTPFNELAKGTSRSVEKIDLHKLLSRHEHLFEKFGGHRGACGFTLKRGQVALLRKGLQESLDEMLAEDPTLLDPVIKWDASVNIADLDMELMDEMELMAPFGNENEKPSFLIEDVLISDYRLIGSRGEHIKFKMFDSEGNGMDAIVFRVSEETKAAIAEKYRTRRYAAVTGYPEINSWQNKKSIQMIVGSLK
jgi:single-stranded-DNA-specific exonuclease